MAARSFRISDVRAAEDVKVFEADAEGRMAETTLAALAPAQPFAPHPGWREVLEGGHVRDSRILRSFEAALLERMSARSAHRGPDDAGRTSTPRARIGLAHRRLSIIDLSPRGHQPMWDVTGARRDQSSTARSTTTASCARELVGRRLRASTSDSDTEVLLHLYLRDGDEDARAPERHLRLRALGHAHAASCCSPATTWA